MKRCPECSSSNLIQSPEIGEVVCQDCGLVVEIEPVFTDEQISLREEEESKLHTGPPLAHHRLYQGITSSFKLSEKNFKGKNLSEKALSSFRRADVQTYLEKKIGRGYDFILSTGDRLFLSPLVLNKACLIFRKSEVNGIGKGRALAPRAAASLFAACRIFSLPRTLAEFEYATLIPKKEIAKYYRMILEKLLIRAPIPDPNILVSKVINKLKMRPETELLALQVLTEAKKDGVVVGKHPSGLVAASVFLAGVALKDKRTQKEVADACNITGVTLRNRSKDLKRFFNERKNA